MADDEDYQEIAVTFMSVRKGTAVDYSWAISGEPALDNLPKNIVAFQAIIAALTPALLVLCGHIDPNAPDVSNVKIDTPNNIN
jgi:hypothetical protein